MEPFPPVQQLPTSKLLRAILSGIYKHGVVIKISEFVQTVTSEDVCSSIQNVTLLVKISYNMFIATVS